MFLYAKLALQQHGSLNIAAWTLVITALVGLALSSVYTGGFSAPVVLLAPIIPIMTVLLIDKRAAWIALAVVCLILACVFILGVYGYVPENHTPPELVLFGRYIVLTSLCLISTWVVASFASISRTLLVQSPHLDWQVLTHVSN